MSLDLLTTVLPAPKGIRLVGVSLSALGADPPDNPQLALTL